MAASAPGSGEVSRSSTRTVCSAWDIGDALAATFPVGNNEMRRVLLVGAPPTQRKMLLAAGCVQVGLALTVFLGVFTHAPYAPPSCDAPRGDWPRPERSSIAYEWSLCCGAEWLLGAVTTTYFVGCLVGGLFSGVLSDRCGRLPVIVFGTVSNALFTIASAFAPNVYAYGAARFMMGAAMVSMLQANFILAAEWVPAVWTAPLTAYVFSACAVGEALLVPMGLLVRSSLGSMEWRVLTAFTGVVCLLPLLAVRMGMSESPQWLHARGDATAACSSLAASAWRSGDRDVARELLAHGLRDTGGGGGGGGADVSPLMEVVRLRAAWAMALLWLTASAIFYGITLEASTYTGSMPLELVVVLSAACEIPSAFLCLALLDGTGLGRRAGTISVYVAGGLSCILATAVGAGLKPLVIVAGKFFVSAAFDAVYLYTSEVFDARVRGSAVGLCSCCARVGAMLAPPAFLLLGVDACMLLFGALALLSALTCHLVLPETGGPPLTAEAPRPAAVELPTPGCAAPAR